MSVLNRNTTSGEMDRTNFGEGLRETPMAARSCANTAGLSLLYAMASMEDVLQAFRGKAFTDGYESDEHSTLKVQESLAKALNKAWNDEYGPSKSYLKAVCKSFIARIGEDHVQSEELLAFLVECLSHCALNVPNPNEHCYLTFSLPSNDDSESTRMRIRIYPHHNDLSLRLWEAGAVLAEFIYANSHLVRDKFIAELGAGVGLTSFVSLAAGASKATGTDYTERALENLRHNYSLQTSKAICHKCKQFEDLHLDWDDVASEDGEGSRFGLRAVADASVLLAADVIYDRSVVPNLVHLIQYFLESKSLISATSGDKLALFAATLRNKSSLDLFESELAARQISSTLLASGQDCEDLPRLFATKFVQPRSDVRIYSLRRMEDVP